MQVRIRADGFDGVMRMVSRGAGLAIVPLAAIERAAPHNFKSVAPQRTVGPPHLDALRQGFHRLPGYAKALLHALTLP